MIVFKRLNAYGKGIGDVVEFPHGVEDTLVNRGIAEFVDTEPVTVAAISEPVATAVEEKPKRRKSQRKQETEE